MRISGRGRIGLTVALLLGWTGSGRAAEPAKAVSGHEQAARELCRVVCGAGSVQTGVEVMSRVKENPETADMEDVFRGWYVSAMKIWDREGAMAQDYMAAFSEQEMRDLLAFYRTPLGQKALAKLPELVRKEAELSGREAGTHEGELETLLAPRLKELEDKKKKADEEKKP
jgi:hypothetical protein